MISESELMDFEILFNLVGGRKRRKDLMKELQSYQEYAKYDKSSLNTVLWRRLESLGERAYVKRKDLGHKEGVFYELTNAGLRYLEKASFKIWLEDLPPTAIQVLETLVHFAISYVFIMAPSGATVEDYIKLLRTYLNKDDLLEKAQGLLKDPRKLYLQFSGHIAKFRAIGEN